MGAWLILFVKGNGEFSNSLFLFSKGPLLSSAAHFRICLLVEERKVTQSR
jgi:hypothetical protein